MQRVFYFSRVLLIVILNSCGIFRKPDYNYTVDAPAGWRKFDTVMQEMKVRYIIAPQSMADDAPMVNIAVVPLTTSNIDEFARRNAQYLRANMAGIALLEEGSIIVGSIEGRWFTYRKTHDGTVREMINYIIPYRGFAYVITGGTRDGTMKNYRRTFDNMARSFQG